MKTFFLTAATLFAATPLLAHDGMHLHPHGIDAATLILGASLVAGGVVAVVIRARK
ncbi:MULTISPECIES: peptidase M23 [Actibacterium]|uniref:Peptidase M23 n=1 Tax=Actibacterium naphthalenivorans TaxID=1614693 RepID=A0A840C3S4_9RHOB|nr:MULTISPECIES: peptidase M23 [Actibacterium]MBB4020344.1 hypothetical protein [Actibacterium naphthalenivorans]